MTNSTQPTQHHSEIRTGLNIPEWACFPNHRLLKFVQFAMLNAHSCCGCSRYAGSGYYLADIGQSDLSITPKSKENKNPFVSSV